METYLYRRTEWRDQLGNVVQVAVAVLAPDWECLSEAVERVGPFDSVADAWRAAYSAALTLRDGQYPGQGILEL